MDKLPEISLTSLSFPQSPLVEQPVVTEKIANDFDSRMMLRCLELAAKALGRTSPNPLVGAVVVQNGEVVGEGFHPRAGEPHAEVFALKAAGEGARGSTIYVSLEPCNHYGRTPPCSEALINAGVSKVVVGMVDPNPLVAGGGIARLRAAGIEVVVGVEEAACRRLNEGFIHRILYQRPLGILKYAMTLDGKIATTSGHSAWVTNQDARAEVHRLRAACDAVIVGGNTVRQDNPDLTSHNCNTHNPLRVVMSRSLNLPEQARLWDTREAPTLVLTEVGSSQTFQNMLREKGVEVLEFTSLTPEQVMTHLYERGFCSVLWECGGILAANAIAQGAVKKIMAFIAPKIIGGNHAPTPVGDLGLTSMTQALPLEQVSWRIVGSDCLVEGYLPSVVN
ncbi:MAG: bifunctional diaminohydroxyphosphoribosylaminopyrimidine deaminase/5-amino-6-(5-phosphoribosylamino)uracil reductase RibD [Dolichospermum sp.]|jgi:diaminohydroxyphosphoribosylaminopyrimidine deaminase/5-amino-6-(5-phosphoribosylamino)uracil reductase|uniref:bifunctional diaminohydroxyphosphoribosylaminopyrimidine deaminase/5-amino-6-(5-phosphoribosylamino)uracil reductase RibD n=1 Tax=Dolichospermum circinale TaxID=109265 RepID=UPI00232BCF0E|nr:bifunctional diaminohydroxyphosphoribosylaminopyrimidine deaminase/5-amino-6-(5-phosphoribosylamino)uracil reductase RibD [Dolichospermum circinale]MCE2718145.1 bifunctional diaminohydroxyphosphoribosylaminopyrimidine deaminase/5-amino-6-(5-phosphoribosylamino)uracil reductase RibD [Anabaena sp. 49628_E55]MDB9491390.1 bifunctional diaminohydroxyphosphoribosylaminopyrimidine deaminase/5-amino-6-(5-phosphoribosylamino)uracil reductase RibD [Dolichospermum circinale CS-534/05]